MTSGYTRPCVFVCEDSNGRDAGEFVVKFGGGCKHADGLLCELVAFQIASLLQLPAPAIALIEVPESLAEYAPTDSIRRSISNSHGLNFGTAFKPGWRSHPLHHSFPSRLQELLHRIFLFDLLIENWDRTPANPNLLVRRDEILLIDHESAFVSARNPSDPEITWRDHNHHHILDHLFYQALKRIRSDPDATHLIFSQITNDRWSEIRDQIPEEWRDTKIDERFNRMERLIFEKVDNFETFLADVQDLLT